MNSNTHPTATFIGHQVRLGFNLGSSYNSYWTKRATLMDIEPFLTANPDQIVYGRPDIIQHEAKKCQRCKAK